MDGGVVCGKVVLVDVHVVVLVVLTVFLILMSFNHFLLEIVIVFVLCIFISGKYG